MKINKKVPKDINKELNLFDRIILHIFSDFSYKVYTFGVKDGYNWSNLGKNQK